MTVVSESAQRSSMQGLNAPAELDRTYSILSYGDSPGTIEDYTLIPVDQEGLVVVKNLVWFE
jgi:hypothetical protein